LFVAKIDETDLRFLACKSVWCNLGQP
jgi:hypothetical protein